MVGATTTSPIILPVVEAQTTIVAPEAIEEKVKDYFKDNPIMIKVSWCESRFRQFEKDGKTIFRGKVNNDDVGVMQINTYYHQKTAEKMGLDLMTLDGNLAYAKYLFEKEGTAPWISSSPCWKSSKSDVAMK